MLFYSSSFPKLSYSRPSDYVPISHKQTTGYALEWANFLYSQWLNGGSLINYDEQSAIQEIRDYAAGRQSTDRYRDRYLGTDESWRKSMSTRDKDKFEKVFMDREGLTNIDFDSVMSPIPAVLRNIQGIMEDTEHKVSMVSTDRRSITAKQELKWQSFSKALNKDVKAMINKTYGVEDHSNQQLPSSLEELEIWDRVGTFKLAYEAAMNDAIDYTDKISDHKEIKNDVVYDLLCIGKAVQHIYSNQKGVVCKEHIDIGDLIIENSKKRRSKDSSFGGHQISMTIADLLNQKDLALTEEQLATLSTSFGTYANNSVLHGIETRVYSSWMDNIRVPVMQCYYLTVNYSNFITTLKDGTRVEEEWKRGEPKMDLELDKEVARWKKPRTYNNETRKTTFDSLMTLNAFKWIIGTEYLWDIHQVEDMPYDYATGEPSLPYAMYKLPGKSLVESFKPIEDEIEMTYLELQNARATSMPAGYDIEFSSIMNLSLSQEGKMMHPMDIIRIKKQTGVGLFTLAPPDPRNPQIVSQKPWSPSEGGFNQAVVTAVNALQLYYGDIERIVGFANVAMGQSPQPEQGLGVTQISLATTNSTLRPIYSAHISIKELSTYIACLKVQTHINNSGDTSPYFDILGPAKFNAIKSAGNFPPVTWGMITIAKLDQNTINQIWNLLQSSVAVGKDGKPVLKPSEAIGVVEQLNGSANLPDIIAYLSFKEQQAEIMSFQRQQAAISGQGESNQKADDNKTKNEIAQIEAKSKAAKELEILKEQLKEKELILTHTLLLNQTKKEKELEVQNQQITPVAQPQTA